MTTADAPLTLPPQSDRSRNPGPAHQGSEPPQNPRASEAAPDDDDVQFVGVRSRRRAWYERLREKDLYDIEIGEIVRARCVYPEDFEAEAENALQEEMDTLNDETIRELSDEDREQRVRERL